MPRKTIDPKRIAILDQLAAAGRDFERHYSSPQARVQPP
jgi:hypothetical protein